MLGPEHERISRCLAFDIRENVAMLPGHTKDSLEPYGSTEFRALGVPGKQGDEGLAPSTRLGRNAWPSIMVEVGYSQSL